jgi:hypothetical protein
LVADRVDAPPGWRKNAPTVWFLSEARKRGLIGDITLDLTDEPSEISAGGALVHEDRGIRHVLLIRVRAEGYELPNGAGAARFDAREAAAAEGVDGGGEARRTEAADAVSEVGGRGAHTGAYA